MLSGSQLNCFQSASCGESTCSSEEMASVAESVDQGPATAQEYLNDEEFTLPAICAKLNLDPRLLPKTFPIQLTERQKDILTVTFASLRQNIAEIGVVVFMRVFESYPYAQQIFEVLKDISQDNLVHSQALKSHAFRVVGFVEKCIARLHRPDKLDAILTNLGQKHRQWRVPPGYLDLLGLQFVAAMKSCLDGEWNPETEEAWIAMFGFITYQMKEAMKMNDGQSALPF